MSLALLTPPAAEPVSLADLKAHLRIDGSNEDALIAGIGVSARTAIEARYGLAIIAQTWRLSLDGAAVASIPLPIGPVSAISSVTVAGAPLSVEDYDVALGLYGRVDLRSRAKDVVVDFVAGWGAPADCPADIRLAVSALSAEFYEHRGDAASDRLYPSIETVAGLIAPYRRTRL